MTHRLLLSITRDVIARYSDPWISIHSGRGREVTINRNLALVTKVLNQVDDEVVWGYDDTPESDYGFVWLDKYYGLVFEPQLILALAGEKLLVGDLAELNENGKAYKARTILEKTENPPQKEQS